MTIKEENPMLLFHHASRPAVEIRKINCKNYTIHVNQWQALVTDIQEIQPSSLFLLTDQLTEKYCLHLFLEQIQTKVNIISIPEGEANKQLQTCQYVWSQLMEGGADRKSLLVNLGGGVVGDLGGFCAATYMRGIPFIQIPTTLLSQVDASIGGKVGIDFMDMKNMIGVVQQPYSVHIFTDFLATLPEKQIRSGYAEMLKHGLIADQSVWHRLRTGLPSGPQAWGKEVITSVEIKKGITEKDPYEKGIRKILNFGHTIGHALESLWLHTAHSLSHGEAIAIGMIAEAFISYHKGLLSEESLFEIRKGILHIFGHHPKLVRDTDEILRLMRVDKKNEGGKFRLVLLAGIGTAVYNESVSDQVVREALLFYREKL
jgi:3-dehydroquinate synthase